MAGAVVRPGAPKAPEKKDPRASATQTERKSNPGVVRAKNHTLRDPSTGIYLRAGELTEVPYFSGWLICQIEAGIVDLESGDPEVDKNQLKDEAMARAAGEPNAIQNAGDAAIAAADAGTGKPAE